MHAAAVADGRIYVAGGFDGIRDLSAAEIYDPRLGSGLPEPVVLAANAVLHASGSRSNSWSSHIDPMNVPRSYHCMVAVLQ